MACHVAVSNTITIPARHQVWLEAEVASSSKEMHDCMGMVEPEPEFVDRHGLYVAHSLSMNRNGFITVQVLNPTFAPIVVHKSEKLGIFQPVQSGSQVHSIETKTNRATQQELPSSNVLETIATMKCSVEGLTQSEQQKFGELLTNYADIISTGDGDIGRTNKIKHQINTQDATPIKQPARRLPLHQHEEVRSMIDSLSTSIHPGL